MSLFFYYYFLLFMKIEREVYNVLMLTNWALLRLCTCNVFSNSLLCGLREEEKLHTLSP